MKTKISYVTYDVFMQMERRLMVRGTRVAMDYAEANPLDKIGAVYWGDAWEDILLVNLAIKRKWEPMRSMVQKLWNALFLDEPFPKIADIESPHDITGLHYEPDYEEAKRLLDICAKYVLDQVYEMLK